MSFFGKLGKAFKKGIKDIGKVIKKNTAGVVAGVLAATGVGGPLAVAVMAGVEASKNKKGGGGSKSPTPSPTMQANSTEKKPLDLKWWHYALLIIPAGFFIVIYLAKGKLSSKFRTVTSKFRGRK